MKKNIKIRQDIRKGNHRVKRKVAKYNPIKRHRYINHLGYTIERIVFPESFDIYNTKLGLENTLQVLELIETISKKFHKNNSLILQLDMSRCEQIKGAASVMLFAAVEQAIKKFGVQFEIKKPIEFEPKGVIENSGLIELCRDSKAYYDFEQSYLPIISGYGGEYRDEIVDFIMHRIYENNLTPEMENIYSDAIQEAINNVGAHAYLPDEESKPWWVKCSLIKDQLFLVIYDTGMGIPVSFQSGNKLYDQIDFNSEQTIESVKETFVGDIIKMYSTFDIYLEALKKHAADGISNEFLDAHIIALAMHENITRRTGKDEYKHGQGSKSIKALVSENDEGLLWIFSNSGLMKFKQTSQLPELKNLTLPIKGTLLQWNIQVNQNGN